MLFLKLLVNNFSFCKNLILGTNVTSDYFQPTMYITDFSNDSKGVFKRLCT